MPCSDGYNPPCDMNALLESNRAHVEISALRHRNDYLAQLLCMICRHVEEETMPTPEEAFRLSSWYAEHKKFDEERNNNRKHDLDGK